MIGSGPYFPCLPFSSGGTTGLVTPWRFSSGDAAQAALKSRESVWWTSPRTKNPPQLGWADHATALAAFVKRPQADAQIGAEEEYAVKIPSRQLPCANCLELISREHRKEGFTPFGHVFTRTGELFYTPQLPKRA
jgi:hypothetical protein